jgi:hypothetical protein
MYDLEGGSPGKWLFPLISTTFGHRMKGAPLSSDDPIWTLSGQEAYKTWSRLAHTISQQPIRFRLLARHLPPKYLTIQTIFTDPLYNSTTMKYTSSLLALASAMVVSAESLGREFTVNLLTQVQDLSISFPQFPDQVPIHWNNASISHVYGDVTYSVVGSLTFNETYAKQSYHIENDQWSTDVRCVF